MTATRGTNAQSWRMKAGRSLPPMASKKAPYHALNRTWPTILARVATVHAVKNISTTLPPVTRRRPRAMSRTSRTTSDSAPRSAVTRAPEKTP
jgi:hypothetical protein